MHASEKLRQRRERGYSTAVCIYVNAMVSPFLSDTGECERLQDPDGKRIYVSERAGGGIWPLQSLKKGGKTSGSFPSSLEYSSY